LRRFFTAGWPMKQPEEIMDTAKNIRVAYQGIDGAYSQEAAYRYFGKGSKTIGCATFDEVVRKVEQGEVEFGILPAENSAAGTIVQTYDLLLESNLQIVGEVYLPVHHNLMILPDAEWKNVRVVYSHPQALAQCAQAIRRFGLRPEATWDTAGSAKKIREEDLRDAAAIASRSAAEVYNLKIVAANIEDLDHNMTRFFVLGRAPFRRGRNHKSSIVFTTRHQPGALVDCLAEFASRGINLTKIESRPDRRKPWHYVFYLDFEGCLEDSQVEQALLQLLKKATFVKVLGSYPAGDKDGRP